MSDGELELRYWGRQRVTRRRVLSGAVAGGAALGAFALVGCSGGDDDNGGNGGPTTDPAGVNDGYQDGTPTAEKMGGIYRVRQAAALPSMNPFGPGIFPLAQGLTLGFTVFDHLWYTPTDTGIVEPFLARTIEQPDDLTLIVTIGDATFHDKAPANGRAVTAEDVAQSFKRFAAEVPIGYSWLQDVMEDIVAVDDHTIRITQKFPWAWVYTSSNAGSPIFTSIMPREILRDNDDLLLRDAIGSGHWVLDSHDNGSNIKLRKFQNFRTFQGQRDITGQPYMDGIDFIFYTDDNAALAAFRAGDLDSTGFSSRKQMEDTEAALGDRIRTSNDLSRDYVNLMLHYEPPFDDVRVREAFNKLIDREEAMLLLEDGDAVKAPPVPPAHKRYTLPETDEVYKEYMRSSVDDAKKLLDAASFNYDEEIELKFSNRPVDSDLAQVLQAQFARGGVKLKLTQEDLVKWFSQTLNQHQFKMTCFQHLAYEDPDLPLRFYLSAEGDRPSNFMDYQDDEVDAAVLAAARELDEEARTEKVFEAQRVIMRKYSPMFNLHSKISFAGQYSYVKGSVTGRGSYGLFNRTTWLDKA